LDGTSVAAVRSLAGRFHWTLVVTKRASSSSAGTVLDQTPAPGVPLGAGAKLRIVVAEPLPAPPPPPPTQAPSQSCTPGYSPCLPPASGYDCIGGSGNGPEYTGTVTVTGSDPYGLD